MKKLVAAVGLSILAGFVFAQSENQGQGGADQSAAATQQMQQMQARLEAMQNLMAQIQGTDDPAERQELMNEYMQQMRAGMNTMNQMMHDQPGAGGAGPSGACRQGDANCRLDMMQRQQGMMGERMNMMQMMMGQMMQMNEQMNHQMNAQMHMQHGPAQRGAN